ncbi:MAG: universal stress protein [Candidatus Marinimicrobia bacterium]|jgi:nucleotide-binding universal stress UspA family protein|nr:universal stress protein [Candidatus Neomarinimicrobiota bacterium]
MKKINKILLALSGDSRESNLLAEAIIFRDQLDAKMDVVHVNPKYAGDMSMMMDSIKEITDTMIIEQIEEYGFTESFPNPEIIILKSDKIEGEISKLSKEYDLVILGHRKMGDIKESISDSIDQDIANDILCPVLIVNKDLREKE